MFLPQKLIYGQPLLEASRYSFIGEPLFCSLMVPHCEWMSSTFNRGTLGRSFPALPTQVRNTFEVLGLIYKFKLNSNLSLHLHEMCLNMILDSLCPLQVKLTLQDVG